VISDRAEAYLAKWTNPFPQLAPQYYLVALPDVLNHSGTFIVPSMCNFVGLRILLKLCPALAFLQQMLIFV